MSYLLQKSAVKNHFLCVMSDYYLIIIESIFRRGFYIQGPYRKQNMQMKKIMVGE